MEGCELDLEGGVYSKTKWFLYFESDGPCQYLGKMGKN